jgi:exonuclease SbcC
VRLRSIRIRNLGPFNDFSADLSALPEEAKLVAVTGQNGSGKTTLLELFTGGSMFRDCRTRGSLASLATARDASLEVQLENGQPWTIRHTVDSISGKGESVVIGADGQPATSTAKVRDFDAWAAAHLPRPELLYGSQVLAQGSGGFLDLKPGDRKAVILRLLGVERLEPMSKDARERARSLDAQATALQSLLADAESRATVDDATGHVGDQMGHEVIKRDAAERAQRSLDAAREFSVSSALAWERYRAQKSAIDELSQRHWEATCGLVDSRNKLQLIDIDAAARRKSTAERAVVASTGSLEIARRVAVEIQQQIDRASQVEVRRSELTAALANERITLEDLERRLRNNRTVLDNATEIRGAVARRAELSAEIQRLELVCTEQRGLAARYGADESSHDSARRRQAEAAAEAERRVERAEKALIAKQDVEDAAQRVDAERETSESLRVQLETAKRTLDELRGRRLLGAEDRIGNLRGALTDIERSCFSNDGSDYRDIGQVARDATAADDLAVKQSEELPGSIAVAEHNLSSCEYALRQAEERLRRISELAARLPAIRVAQDEFGAALAARDTALLAAAESEQLAQEAHRLAMDAAKARQAAQDKQNAAQADIASLERLASKAPVLDTAEARLAELSPVAEAAGARVGTLIHALAQLPEPERVPAPPKLDALQGAVDAAQREVQAATAVLARAESDREHLTAESQRWRGEEEALRLQLEALQEPKEPEQAPRLEELEAALRTAKRDHGDAVAALAKAQAALEAAQAAASKAEEYRKGLENVRAEQADWNRLGEDLGRDGLQAALVDSACAQLTAVTNDLLHSCVGTRWTVSLETQRVSADGKKQIEGFDVKVLDTEAGRDTTVETLSGGEKVLVGEAVSLALTTLACARAGIERPTLVRDETGAALDPEKARAYVAMLRRAAQQIGADRVLFVCHSREVQELADARIEIGAKAKAEA